MFPMSPTTSCRQEATSFTLESVTPLFGIYSLKNACGQIGPSWPCVDRIVNIYSDFTFTQFFLCMDLWACMSEVGHSLAPSLPTLFFEMGSLSEPRAHQFIQTVWAVSSGSLRSLLLQHLYYRYVTQWLIGFCTCAENPHAVFTLAQQHPLSEHLHRPW